MEIDVAIVRHHKNTSFKNRRHFKQIQFLMKQKEHVRGLWKTWHLAGTEQLYDSGKMGLGSFFCNMRRLDSLISELRKLEGILKPSEKDFGNVFYCCHFSSKNNLAWKSLVQREFDSP